MTAPLCRGRPATIAGGFLGAGHSLCLIFHQRGRCDQVGLHPINSRGHALIRPPSLRDLALQALFFPDKRLYSTRPLF